MDFRVDRVLAAAADRDLELVAGRRQVQRAADGDERPRHVEREVALEPGRLDLRLLAQPLCLEERTEGEPQEEDDDGTGG